VGCWVLPAVVVLVTLGLVAAAICYAGGSWS